jgi:hypothetical protein
MPSSKLRWLGASIAAMAIVVPGVSQAAEEPSPANQLVQMNGAVEPGQELRPEDSTAAAPCGLTWISLPYYVKRYTIRNCHSYVVWRKLDIRLGSDGDCHAIGAYTEGTWDIVVRPPAAIRGMKAC